MNIFENENAAIVKRFSEAQKSLVIQTSDLSLNSIKEMAEGNAIDLSPKYQRRERWDAIRKSELIESFILNVPVPPIYLAEEEYGVYSVIDGKQRVTAIYEFMTGKLTLGHLTKFPELNGKVLNDLPSDIVNSLTVRPYLRVVTLLKQSDPDIKHEVFLRLNKSGVRLTSQEIRNVAFRGNLNDMLFNASRYDFFSRQLKTDDEKSKNYSEMLDVQFVLRFFTLREIWTDFSGNVDYAMDAFMMKNTSLPKKELGKLEKRFYRAVDACESIWGDTAYYRPKSGTGNWRSLVLQGMFDAQMLAVDKLSDSEIDAAILKKNRINKSFSELLENDLKFIESITQFTSNPERLKYRVENTIKLLRK